MDRRRLFRTSFSWEQFDEQLKELYSEALGYCGRKTAVCWKKLAEEVSITYGYEAIEALTVFKEFTDEFAHLADENSIKAGYMHLSRFHQPSAKALYRAFLDLAAARNPKHCYGKPVNNKNPSGDWNGTIDNLFKAAEHF
jgi:hypothetical protein